MGDGVSRIVAAALVAAGLAGGGWLLGRSFVEARAGERWVTVKGISEREVKADLALWPLRFVATGNDLAAVQRKVAADAGVVSAFLTREGFAAGDVELLSLEVTDLFAQAFRSGPVESRFIVAQTLMVRSQDVDRVVAASQKVAELVSAGIVLNNDMSAANGPSYVFTGLTAIKPAMIAEATRNARAGAERFAADSASVVGSIRRANQGVFEILPRDQAAGIAESRQVQKTVRVVSTIEYYLDR
jgi:uncharacterized protein